MRKNVLITGVAGFIGFSLANKILSNKNLQVIGIDNLNEYYDVSLKKDRLNILKKNRNFLFKKIDICNYKKLNNFLKKFNITKVFHLAAQAGVRYSLINPGEYINSNIVGFFNILDISKNLKIKHFIYASSSSVYGASAKKPFNEKNNCAHPIQLYAASKRSNELIAHSYSALYNIPTSGVRFFTAYGPWGRPDQALFKFTKNIIDKKKIQIFNRGHHIRDFTYIDDIVKGLLIISKNIPKFKNNFKINHPDTSCYPFEIYNIGANRKISLMKYINLIEKNLSQKAKKKLLPLQKGDIIEVSSSIKKIKKLKFKPTFNVETGIKKFVDWFKSYYQYK